MFVRTKYPVWLHVLRVFIWYVYLRIRWGDDIHVGCEFEDIKGLW